MAWLKKNFLFTLIIVVLVGAIAVQAFYILGARSLATETEEDFDQLVEEYRSLTTQEILPHEENVALTSAEIDRQREELELFYTALEGRDDLDQVFANPPDSRTAAFFEIRSFVEEYRRRVLRAEVQMPENEFFGFQAYQSEGPNPDQIPSVHRQMVIVGYILDNLLETRPLSFHQITRPDQGASVPAALSLRTDEVADTLPFVVTFTGYTSTLREFANRLSSYDLPVVIRQVQATPSGGQQRDTPQRQTRRRGGDTNNQANGAEATEPEEEEDGSVRLVAASPMQYTVSMEFLDVQPLEANDSR